MTEFKDRIKIFLRIILYNDVGMVKYAKRY